MREKHPIDERFRQALYHGEADPPEAVRAALGTHLGWTSAPRTSGGWWPMVIVAVGLIGTGAALWAWQNDPSSIAMNGERQATEQRVDDASVPANDATPLVPSAAIAPAAPTGQGTGSITNSAAIEQRGAAAEGGLEESRSASDQAQRNIAVRSAANAATAAGTKAAVDLPTENQQQARSGSGSEGKAQSNTTTTPVVPDDSNNTATSATKTLTADQDPLRGTPEPPAPLGVSDPSAFAEGQRSIMMDPLRIAPDAMVPGGSPINRALPPNYVLPSGTWWIGAYVGIGTVQGTWKGADAHALQEAEQWQSTMQGGSLVGREWRSGWGFSTGLGIARVRSTFQHDDATQGSSVLEVDTTWAQTMHTSGDILYSWQIDSLTEEVPGGLVRRDARNLYTAIQVPLLLHWHADARRLRYGAFGGFNAWIPTQRKGLTLVNSQQDSPPTTLALQDPKVDDRFGTQVHGVAGISVGYTITEQFSAYAEPMISAPLISFDGGNTPWLTRPLLQFRLQYELRSKGR